MIDIMRHQDICMLIGKGFAKKINPDHQQELQQQPHMAVKQCHVARGSLSDGCPSANACTGLISSIGQATCAAWKQHIQDQHSAQLPNIINLASDWAALQAASPTTQDQSLLAQSKPQPTYSCPLGCKHVPEASVPCILRQGHKHVLEQHILNDHLQELQFAIQLAQHLSESSNHNDKCLIPGCSFSASQHVQMQQQGIELVRKYNVKVMDKEDWELLHRNHAPIRDAGFQTACKNLWQSHYLSSADHSHMMLLCALHVIQHAKRSFAANSNNKCNPWLVRCAHTGCIVNVNSISALLQHEAHFHYRELARQNWAQIAADNQPSDAHLLACPIPDCPYACTTGSGIARHITSEHASLAKHVSHALAMLAVSKSKNVAQGDRTGPSASQHAVAEDFVNVSHTHGTVGLARDVPAGSITGGEHVDRDDRPLLAAVAVMEAQQQLGYVPQSPHSSQPASSTPLTIQANTTTSCSNEHNHASISTVSPSPPLHCPLLFNSHLQLGDVGSFHGEPDITLHSTANCTTQQLALHHAVHSTATQLSSHFTTDHAEFAAACIDFAAGLLSSHSDHSHQCNLCKNTDDDKSSLDHCQAEVSPSSQVETVLQHNLDHHMPEMLAMYHMVCLLAATAGRCPERGKLHCPFGCVSEQSSRGSAPRVSSMFLDSRYNGETPPSSMVAAAFGGAVDQPVNHHGFADVSAVLHHIMTCHGLEAFNLTKHAMETKMHCVTHV